MEQEPFDAMYDAKGKGSCDALAPGCLMQTGEDWGVRCREVHARSRRWRRCNNTSDEHSWMEGF